jgi:enoyl-CoA hydratase
MNEYLSVERRGRVSIVQISRPEKRNAFQLSMLERLRGILVEEEQLGATSIVLTGGPVIFSAGMDFSEIGRGASDVSVDDSIAETALTIRQVSMPVIAAVEGPCIGGAFEIAIACDLRIAAKGSYFSVPATRLGILYRPGAIASLVNTLGRETVTRLFVLNERIGAEQAVVVGIASHLTDTGGALDAALELASGVPESSMDSVRATKQLINEMSRVDSNFAHWEGRRRAILSSKTRSEALTKAVEELGDGDARTKE